jgi:cell division septal protein FtsQ
MQFDSVGYDSDLESPRKHTHKLAITRRKVTGTLLVVVAAIVATVFLVSHLTATVSVGVSDKSVSRPLEQARYANVIHEYLDSNPLSRLSFLLDEKALTDYVSSKLPEVEHVYQRGMSGLGETNFIIKMRTPIAGWKIGDKQYYVDSSGIPFDQNYFASPVVQIVDNSGVSVQNSTTAIASKRFLAFVGRVVSLASGSGYIVTQAALPPNTTRELELHLKDIGYYVKLSIDRPAGEQVEDMANAIRYFARTGQAPSLHYIDVRVGGKAFYK